MIQQDRVDHTGLSDLTPDPDRHLPHIRRSGLELLGKLRRRLPVAVPAENESPIIG
jgi:hypothetical protein